MYIEERGQPCITHNNPINHLMVLRMYQEKTDKVDIRKLVNRKKYSRE